MAQHDPQDQPYEAPTVEDVDVTEGPASVVGGTQISFPPGQ
jgi:hypothetical protein